jgi:uncharacterized protein YbjQ (UPF0145 family)
MARPQLGALPGSPVAVAFGDTASAGTAGNNAALSDHRHAAPANPVTAHESASDPHTGYMLESLADAAGDIFRGTADNTIGRLAITVPAANILNVLGVVNGETNVSWKSVHDSTTPAAVGTAGSAGSSLYSAHRDHVHGHETAHIAHDTIWDTAGDLVVGTGADTAGKLAISVPAVNIMNVLGVVNGETTWSVKALHDATNPAAISNSASPGTSTLSAHRDHVHAHEAAHVAHDTLFDAVGDLVVGTGADTAGKLAISVPAANIVNVLGVVNGETTWSVKSLHDGTAPAAIGTSAAGTSLFSSHRDHVHATGAGTPSTQAFGDSATTGSGPAAAMTDHKHAMPANPVSYAVPALTLGTANAAGSAATLIRTDATILAFDATSPSTQAFGDAAVVGTATVAARRDHKHAMMAQSTIDHGTISGLGDDDHSIYIKADGTRAFTGTQTVRNLFMAAHNTYDIGESATRPANIYTRSLYANSVVEFATANVVMTAVNSPPMLEVRKTNAFGANDAVGTIYFEGVSWPVASIVGRTRVGTPVTDDAPGQLVFATTPDGSATPLYRWTIDETGHFVPFADSVYDIGATALRPSNIYTDNIDTMTINSPTTNVYMYSTFQ